MTAQHRIPDETTETTQARELLEHVDLACAVVTADAANAQRDTADYIAGPAEDGVTKLGENQATAADLARLARGQWGIESVHWLRDFAYRAL